MEKKQSSVEWYANASHELIVKKSNGEITEREFLTMHHNLFYEAEAMHKEEIIEAVYDSMGTNFDPNMGRAELYYKEKYENGGYK